MPYHHGCQFKKLSPQFDKSAVHDDDNAALFVFLRRYHIGENVLLYTHVFVVNGDWGHIHWPRVEREEANQNSNVLFSFGVFVICENQI